jgi:hypothetical protein
MSGSFFAHEQRTFSGWLISSLSDPILRYGFLYRQNGLLLQCEASVPIGIRRVSGFLSTGRDEVEDVIGVCSVDAIESYRVFNKG